MQTLGEAFSMQHSGLLQAWLSGQRYRPLAAGLLLCFLYAVFGLLGFTMVVPPSLAAPFWPAAGVGAAGTLLLGSKAWPWIFVGSALTTTFQTSLSLNLTQIALIASASALEGWLVAVLAGKFFTRSMTFVSDRGVWGFLILGGALSPSISATLSNLFPLLFGLYDLQLFAGQWLSWWAGNAIGISLITPIILFIASPVKILSRMFFAHIAPPLLVLLFISAGHISLNYYQLSEQKEQQEKISSDIRSAFHTRIVELLRPLESTAHYLLASEQVNSEEFELFVGSEITHTGYSLVGWAPRVAKEQRETFEQSRGFNILAMHEGGATTAEEIRNNYYPVTLIYPKQSRSKYLGINVMSRCFEPYPIEEAILTDKILFIPPSSRRCRQLNVTWVIKPVHADSEKGAEGAVVAGLDLRSEMADLITLAKNQNLALVISTHRPDESPVELISTSEQHSYTIARFQDTVGNSLFTINLLAKNAYWQHANSPINYFYILFTLVSAFAISVSMIGSANRQAMNAFEIRSRTRSLSRELEARKTAEQQLSKTTTLLSTAIDMADLGVWQIDFSAGTFILSDNLLRMLDSHTEIGETRAIPIEKFIRDYFPAADSEKALATFAGSDPNRLHYRLEHGLRRKDGQTITVQSQCHVQRDSNNRPLHAQGISLNVSRFREAEEALRRARDDAEAANRAKSDFLARMSHEIRTPMNGVIGMLELLQQDSRDAEQQASLNIAQSSANHLLRIIDDILDFSKIEAGSLTLENITFSPLQVAAEVLELMTPIAQKKQVQLHCYARTGTPTELKGDPVRLRQILINLIGNAVKYCVTPNTAGAVQVLLSPSSKLLRIDIIDNGIGIDKEVLPKLFSPFSQADESTTRFFGGTGLGLTISKELAELMGGSITASSTPNEKTCFSLRLPLHQSRAAATETCIDSPPQDLLLCGIAPDCAKAIADDNRQAGGNCHLIERADERPQLSGERPVVLVMHSEAAMLTSAEQAALCAELSVERVISVGGEAAALSTEHIAMGNTVLTLSTIANPTPKWASTASDTTTNQQNLTSTLFSEKLLVAEDSDINRKVIAQQLARCGYSADFAEDGEEALQLWRQHEYPVVITDLHMPNRDGYSLATEIRDREHQTGRVRTTIIALSANVISGAREKCHAAGIDAYLTKPTSIETLRQCLALHATPVSQQHTSLEPQTLTEELPVLDPQVFKDTTGGDDALAAEFFALFKNTLDEAEHELEALLEQGDAGAIANFAHTLKSSAEAIGALQLAAQCREMERDYGSSATLSQQLIRRWRHCVAQLRPALDQALSDTV